MTVDSRPFRRIPRLAIAVAAALLPALSAAQAWTGCDVVTRRPAPVPDRVDGARFGGLPEAPANDVGCLFGWPLQVDAQTVIWRCMIDPDIQEAATADDGSVDEYIRADGTVADDIDPGRWEYALMLMRDGQPVRGFRDALMAGYYHAWSIHEVDLDGDGRRENLVALWNGQGNGMGVNGWTLRLFSADWQLLASRADVADWGPSALRAAPSPRQGCDIGVTGWVEDRSTGREGIAFEAKFLRLQDGRLVEATDQPPVRRRYTNRFQAERTAWFDAAEDRLEGDPAGWLGGARK